MARSGWFCRVKEHLSNNSRAGLRASEPLAPRLGKGHVALNEMFGLCNTIIKKTHSTLQLNSIESAKCTSQYLHLREERR
jgi:hypothetical protein